MYIDTHCHIEKDNAHEYIENAKKANVMVMINASVDMDSSKENTLLANMYDSLYIAVGIHPEYASKYKNSFIKETEKLILDSKVKAIGEIGLDYYYTKENKNEQIKMFRDFLELAERHNLPVVVHSREATQDTLDIIKEYKVRGVIHCFNGSLEIAKEYIKIGFYLGVGGVITFKNSRTFEVIREIPLEYIVLETDAPYLTPEPFRKYKNESKYIPVIAEYIANLKGVSIQEVMEKTTRNAKVIFDI